MAESRRATGASASAHVLLRPRVVTLGAAVTVRIDGWGGSRLEVALDGATNRNGRLLGWRAAAGRWKLLEATVQP